jgi:hypothetical protein
MSIEICIKQWLQNSLMGFYEENEDISDFIIWLYSLPNTFDKNIFVTLFLSKKILPILLKPTFDDMINIIDDQGRGMFYGDDDLKRVYEISVNKRISELKRCINGDFYEMDSAIDRKSIEYKYIILNIL